MRCGSTRLRGIEVWAPSFSIGLKAKRKVGCTMSHLDTFDFQARDFYERNGYELFGALDDCPPGHKRYYLKKAL
jgi:hypothetical protein